MGRRMLRHLRSHVIAYVALFFALTGTAVALPGHNTVFSDDIKNEQVKAADIRENAVGSSELRTDAVGSAVIRADAVGSDEIGADAVGSSETGANAIRGSELLNYHVHDGTAVNVNDPTGLDGDFQQVTATASCTAGEQLVGYYSEWTSAGDENAAQEIIPDFGANSVTARGITDDGGTETFRAAAVCLFD